MSGLPLVHAFFTNAYGRERGGFRHLDLRLTAPPADRNRFRRWLGGLRPLGGAGGGDGWAVRAFRLGETLYAVLVRIVPAFARDEFGREGGYLCHALLAPLEEGGPVVRYGPALREAALRLSPPADLSDRDRLDALLANAEREAELDAAPLTASDLESLGRDLPEAFITTVCDLAIAAPAAAILPEPSGDLADALLRAAEVLPPRLQLGLRWAIGAASTGEPATALRIESRGQEGIGRFGSWVAARLAAGGAPEVLKIAENWQIRNEAGLGEALEAFGPMGVKEL
ncbi:MAG TPA: hypothetical protein VN851_28375 [Thermoanaerobaculia bacterium]|nr:hypothetical protein [Thermoanaerobaculia bacterium]